MRPYPTLTALRSGQDVQIEGVTVRKSGEWQDLKPGDLYVAERNTGPRLLTVREVKPVVEHWAGWVVPVEIAYCFDLGECVKVEVDL